jgi:hypothetical protein
MSRFDERAEATAERRPGGKKGPSKEEIRRVRRALATGHRTLKNNLTSIDVTINIIDTPNTSIEFGPPPVGSHSNTEAVRFMRRVADDIRRIRNAVTDVEFNPDDKQKFRLALKELAHAWDLRAEALGESDTKRAAAKLRLVHESERRAAGTKRALAPYFPKVDEYDEEDEEDGEDEPSI